MCSEDCKCEKGKCPCKDCTCKGDAAKKEHEDAFGYTHPAHADGLRNKPLAPEIETEDGTIDNPNDDENFPDN